MTGPLRGEEGDDHSAHHGAPAVDQSSTSMSGGGMNGTPPTMPSAQSGMAGGMSSMMKGMMGGEGEHGGNRRSPFFTRLMAYPALASGEREAIARQANQRIEDGLSLIDAGNAAAMHAPTPQARLEAARELREGLDLLNGGAAAQAALQGEQDPSVTAQNWFRNQLGLVAPIDHEANTWFGVSPSHFLLMMFLAIVSAGLLTLQALRLRRVRQIVATSKGGPASAADPVKGRIGKVAIAPSAAEPQVLASAAKASVIVADMPPLSKRFAGQLKVAQIVRETPTVRTFRLVAPGADRLPFDFCRGSFCKSKSIPMARRPPFAPTPLPPRQRSAPMSNLRSSGRSRAQFRGFSMTTSQSVI
jgi:hypothetical protein